MFQMVEQARKNQKNPMEMFKEVTKNYSPEQINAIYDKARQFGVPNEVIQQFQLEIEKK